MPPSFAPHGAAIAFLHTAALHIETFERLAREMGQAALAKLPTAADVSEEGVPHLQEGTATVGASLAAGRRMIAHRRKA